METKERTLILDHWQVEQTIRRIAHQILEEHYKEKSIVIVGVEGVGADISKLLVKEISSICEIEIQTLLLSIAKDKPLSEEMKLDADLKSLKNKTVLLVDDVLNSGRTLIYAAAFLLNSAPKMLRTVVLVDRIHRKFPIRADFVGVTLSTNIKEHVAVVKEGKNYAAYLD